MATERTGLTAAVKAEAETRLDTLVPHVQLKGWPSSTLFCARVVKGLIIFAVLATSITLVLAYFGGALVLQTAVVKITDFAIPQVVVCPVWGQKGLEVSKVGAWIGNIATTDYTDWKALEGLTTTACASTSFQYLHMEEEVVEIRPVTGVEYTCACIDAPPGTSLRAEDVGKQSLRLAFDAAFTDGHRIPHVAFGFAPGPGLLPNDWGYAPLLHRSLGTLELELRSFGKTAVTQGTTLKAYTYDSTATYPVAQTELVVAPRSFFITKVKDVSSVFSVFALVSFLILLMANMNSVALFNVCFPAQLDKKKPQQLQPHWCFQSACASLSCCRPVDPAEKDTVV